MLYLETSAVATWSNRKWYWKRGTRRRSRGTFLVPRGIHRLVVQMDNGMRHFGLRISVVFALLVCALLGDGRTDVLAAGSACPAVNSAADTSSTCASDAIGHYCAKAAPSAAAVVVRSANTPAKRIVMACRNGRDQASSLCPSTSGSDTLVQRACPRFHTRFHSERRSADLIPSRGSHVGPHLPIVSSVSRASCARLPDNSQPCFDARIGRVSG